MSSEVFNDFRLVGGTALALQRGHRRSVDIDMPRPLFVFSSFRIANADIQGFRIAKPKELGNLVYQQLLSDKLKANLGYIYENLVAQMLKSRGNEFYYYTWPTDNGKHNYEIDFLLSRGNKIVPIEVKSSGYKTHKSLDEFCKKYPSRVGERILLYTKDYQKDGVVTYLPVYYAALM
jgi:Holliday junction resolvase-like predicted endonuclease